MKWDPVRSKTRPRDTPGRGGASAGPGKRWGHTCNSVKNGRTLYVFGGYGKDNRQTNDTHVFDTAKQTWSKPTVKGSPPSPRDSHSCTTVGASLYVFGGTDGKRPLQDLYVLDTVTHMWSKPQIGGDGPAPREGHSAALVGQHLFIFGGCGKSSDDSKEIYYNDLYILDTVKLLWTKAITKGRAPTPRDSHTCSAWNNKLVVLGGEDASDSYLSDVHILNTDVMEWKELQTTGQKLMPRAGHATVSIGKHVFVFGGFTDDRNLFDDLHMLNIETGVWTKPITMGMGPSARFSVAGDCVDAASGILVFIGGCNENLEALDDMYYLDTELKPERGTVEKPEKFSLRKELKRKRLENQIISGEPDNAKEAPPISPSKPKLVVNTAASVSPTVGLGVGSDKVSLYEFKPVEEKIFEAKITDVFHYGYMIEANIDGKRLRGLLFSYKPGFSHAAHAYLTRKKMSLDASADNLNEAQKPKLKIARAAKYAVKRSSGQAMAMDHEHHGEIQSTAPDQNAAFTDPYHHDMQQHHHYQPHPQLLQQGIQVSAAPSNVVRQELGHFSGSGYPGLPHSSSESSHLDISGTGLFSIHPVASSAQAVMRDPPLEPAQQRQSIKQAL